MMRTKEEILKDTLRVQSEKPYWDNPDLLLAPLTIEILIDIRDELTALKTILKDYDMVCYKSG